MERLSQLTQRMRSGSVSAEIVPRARPFVAYAKCLMEAKGNRRQAQQNALQHYANYPEVARVLEHSPVILNGAIEQEFLTKSPVSPGSTTDTNFAAALSDWRSLISGFLAALQARTVVGRLVGLRRIPFDTLVAEQTTNASGAFVAAGDAAPASMMAFGNLTMRPLKCVTMVVVTADLVRSWSAASDAFVQESLLRALAVTFDTNFLDPLVGGDGISTPRSVTNGALTAASTGATAATIAADAKTLLDLLVAAGSDLANVVFIAHPRTATYLSTLTSTTGALVFPDVAPNGGTFLNLPLLVSSSIPLVGSPSVGSIVALDPARIFYADDGGLSVDISGEASVQLTTTPNNSATSLVSLWQQNLAGFLATRFVNWSPGVGACATLTGVTY